MPAAPGEWRVDLFLTPPASAKFADLRAAEPLGSVSSDPPTVAPRKPANYSERLRFREDSQARLALFVLILLTNDDGIFAPGLAALERQLQSLGEVYVVAPAAEQSGVGHSITYLSPLIVKETFAGQQRRGWAVEGSPADCVKLGICECCPRRPDLVVSGINSGLNAGINVLYSGTVAAAIEGAFFGITSFAVSLEFDEHADYSRAATLATQVIRQTLAQKPPEPQLYNLNLPIAALEQPSPAVQIVPMGTSRYGEHYEKRQDPRGRNYYWAGSDPPPPPGSELSDLTALRSGSITLTPLHFDLTRHAMLQRMGEWQFDLQRPSTDETPAIVEPTQHAPAGSKANHPLRGDNPHLNHCPGERTCELLPPCSRLACSHWAAAVASKSKTWPRLPAPRRPRPHRPHRRKLNR